MFNFFKSVLRICALSAPCLMGTACGGGVSVGILFYDEENTVDPVPFQEIAPTQFSAIEQRRQVVVRDLTTWDALWREHTANQSPAPALPPVNFSQDMVIGVFLGSRSNGCYKMAIESITKRRQPTRLEVVYRESTPPPNVMCSTVITHPAVMVVTPYSQLPVEFIEVR